MNEDHGNQHAAGGSGADDQPRAPIPPREHATSKVPPIPAKGPASAGPAAKSPVKQDDLLRSFAAVNSQQSAQPSPPAQLSPLTGSSAAPQRILRRRRPDRRAIRHARTSTSCGPARAAPQDVPDAPRHRRLGEMGLTPSRSGPEPRVQGSPTSSDCLRTRTKKRTRRSCPASSSGWSASFRKISGGSPRKICRRIYACEASAAVGARASRSPRGKRMRHAAGNRCTSSLTPLCHHSFV